MKQLSSLTIIILFFFLYFVLGTWNLCSASQIASFGIYPPKISVISPPSQSVKIPIKVVNGADLDTLTFSASAVKVDEEGSIRLIGDPEEAITWLKIDDEELSYASLKIDAGSESSFTLKIDIPKSAMENDHYLALIISSKSEETAETTHSEGVAQIALPIIISIKDRVVPEKLTVESLKIPGVSLSSEIPIGLTLKNPGLYLVETVGTITAKGLLSSKHQEIIPKVAVLSNSTRLLGGRNYTFNTEVVGPTTITISIQLDKSSNLVISKNVLIIPAFIPIIFIIIIFLIITAALKSSLTPKK